MIGDHLVQTRQLVLVVCAAVLLAGCGIPAQDAARPIPDEEVPSQLFEVLETTSTTESALAPVNLRLFWHTDADVLVAVTRSFTESPTLPEALRDLTLGPSEREQTEHPAVFGPRFTQALAPTQLSVVEGTATILVADQANFRGSSNRRVTAWEIVCTTLQFKLVERVIIADSQGEISLSDIDARPIEGPADASHYGDCEVPAPIVLPDPTTTTTTG